MQQWHYHPASDIGLSLSERLRHFPREPLMLDYVTRFVAELLLRIWMRLYHRLSIIGREHLPPSGPYILICNHTSHLDTLAMLCALPLRKIHNVFPAAAADYFFSSTPRCAVSSVLINALPFDRAGHGSESLASCRALLASGENVLILFPEGTRSTNGELGRFRSGIGRLAAGRDIPVVPCFLDGGMASWPKGRAFPRPAKLTLRIGRPHRFPRSGTGRQAVQSVCETLQGAVARLGEVTQ